MTQHQIDRVRRQLQSTFDGDLFIPGDDGYDDARASWHRTVDPRPAIVAEATSTNDVSRAVQAATTHGLPFAVQATGHGTYTPTEGGILLKTSRLKSVNVDPSSRTVQVGPGARWSDVVSAAAPFGLAPVSGTLSIGVTGYTLGGGAGFMSRTFGLAADSLVRADVVTSGGQHVSASGDEHPDLHWALRGGGGNFGVVTMLEFLLHPVSRVYAGMSFYDAERVPDVLAQYHDWAFAAPSELNTAIILARMPDMPQLPESIRGRPVLGIRAFYRAEADAARRHLDSLLETAGPPLMDGFAEQTFADASLAAGGPAHPPMAVDQRFGLFRELPIDVTSNLADVVGGPVTIELRHWGGAVARPSPNAGPAGHRDVPYSILATTMGESVADLAATAPSLNDLVARLHPHATGGSFLNFLNNPALTETAYTAANYRRLTEVKRVWDPDNLFRAGHNIPPATHPAEAITQGAES